ncbi:MAG: 30S ribosomal protein S18 [Verrucomicrobia bacterium]|mgnify:FL=1|nr:30S ribosomal protein S18 [Verrucomicrobiota bacterium]
MLTKKPRRPRRMHRSAPRRRIDINADAIDFRNTELLRKFITERGKILPRRVTGMPARLHRKLNQAIKRARNALLLK